MKLTRRAMLIAMGGAALALAGCRAQAQPRVVLAGSPTLPAWLEQAHADVRDLYAWARGHQQELSYIPCYCGCVRYGHQNNFDCYFMDGDYTQHAVS